jgi:peptidoglycan hydrolase CwlO-like protein
VGLLFFLFITNSKNVLADTTRDDLENQLKDIEEQIVQYEKQLASTQVEKKSLTNKLNSLKNTQASLKLQIKKTSIIVDSLEKQIGLTERQISETKNKIIKLKKNIAPILILMNEKDNTRLIEILTTQNYLSDFYDEIRNYTRLSQTLNEMVEKIKISQQDLSKKQIILEDKQESAKNLLTLKNLQQQELTGSIQEQSEVLKETKGKESQFQEIIKDSKKRAAAIRSRIYDLVDGEKKINFGEALELANWASKQTGIRSAFLLAILTQESNLGKNIGTCNRPGDPPEKSWKVIMKPTRDQEPFQIITAELGKNPDITPVSCPMKDKKGKQLGWGGAMGPAQFIPSTWIGYRQKITAITGNTVANPWDNRDAFLASAIKLRNDGANGTDEGDWKAAMRYFSGSTNLAYRFYGDNVIKTTHKYLSDIEDLK